MNLFFRKKELLVPDDMAWTIDRHGNYYEKGVDYWLGRLLKRLKRPIFFDVGANFGYYSVRYANRCDAVYAFEPVKETYKYLEYNVKNFKRNNVHLLNCGLSDAEKEMDIHVYSSSGCNSLYKRNIPEGHDLKLVRTEKIQLTTLEKIIDFSIAGRQLLVKIDVEGAEKEVLQGASNLIGKAVFLFEFSPATCGDAGYERGELLEFFNMEENTVYGFPEDESDIRLISFEDFSNFKIANVLVIPNTYGKVF